MGWTSLNLHGQAPLDYIKMRLFMLDKTETRRAAVLDIAAVGTTYYIALEVITTTDGVEAREVRAYVCLTSRKGFNGNDFGYNCYSEHDGTYEVRCPRRILNLLTPLELGPENQPNPSGYTNVRQNQYALDWRARCEVYHAAKKVAIKLKKGLEVGDIVVFARAVTFSNLGEFHRFELVDKAKHHFYALFLDGRKRLIRLRRTTVSAELLAGSATIEKPSLAPALSDTSSGLAPALAVTA